MEKKKKIAIIVSFLIILFILFSVYKSENLSLNPINTNNPLIECKVIKQTESGNINLLFFSKKETAEKYANSLLEISPFNENKESFNIYYIDNYKPKCEIYKEQALLCYNEELIKKAASCPNDIIVAIEEENKEIRSSSYMNLLSINSQHPLIVIAHEFGHSFANLAEEYVPAKIPKGAKNCVKDCSNFGETKEGCFQGCSKSDYYRSTEAGIMRTLSSINYGIFNENIISNEINKKIEQLSLTGHTIENKEDCSNKKYYLIKGIYSNEKISIKSITTEIGCAGGNGKGSFIYEQILKNNVVIEKEDFSPEFIFTTDPENMEKGETYTSDIEFMLTIPIPITEQTKLFKITQEDGQVIEINFQEFSEKMGYSFTTSTTYELKVKDKGILNYVRLNGLIVGEGDVKIYLDDLLILDNSKFNGKTITGKGVETPPECGNGICESGENYLTCKEDCLIIPECGNGIIEPDEECDDENNQNGDGCSSICLIEHTPPINPIVCGNGVIESGEECDDRNQLNGDGCSSTCRNETTPSQPICGNKICEKGESTLTCLKDCHNLEITQKFTDKCEETCDLNKLNLNKDSYTIRIEISNAKLRLDEIKYEILIYS